MKNKLGENIRALRKSRSLTQEQLAEAMGVSAGAVYKWEAQLSTPDIEIIILLAEYFEVSVDVLLGYEMQSSKLSAMLERINSLFIAGDVEKARSESERALQKYPNSFELVYKCALFHFMSDDTESLRRSLALFKRSLELIDQNTDEHISEGLICGMMAQIHAKLDEYEEAIELLKKHNQDGSNNAAIGEVLARGCKKPDEALLYLSNGLDGISTKLVRLCVGYANAYGQKEDYARGTDIMLWLINIIDGMRTDDCMIYLDKICAVLFAGCAEFAIEMGDSAKAREYLKKAYDIAVRFDAEPINDMRNLKFYHGSPNARSYDDLGATALEAAEKIIREEITAERLIPIWKEICNEKN